ncbi:MAG: metalloregulator ArsR/SmtB family transcription factor [Verrucomicrobiales bacterium]|nr:metalloregulator ArsR/SmtB family transcription factor [Verrucomicrobiales bacterium]
MASILKNLRLITDPTRLRILRLLKAEELSVVELQEVLGMGQSRISTHLSQLKKQKLVADRRSGKNVMYSFNRDPVHFPAGLVDVLDLAATEVEEIADDEEALKLVLAKRKDKARAYFDELAGKFGRSYVPGRSWKALSETLLKLLPPMVIADLGAGEGTFSQLLAQRAEKVIAIDSSPKMVDYGAGLAKEHGYDNLEYRIGDIEEPPIEDNSVDLAFFSQALHHASRPEKAISSAYRILKPGGRIVILDLLKHQFEDARELYADVWLGFSELEVSKFLGEGGFGDIEIAIVDRESEPPHFQTLMAIGQKQRN